MDEAVRTSWGMFFERGEDDVIAGGERGMGGLGMYCSVAAGLAVGLGLEFWSVCACTGGPLQVSPCLAWGGSGWCPCFLFINCSLQWPALAIPRHYKPARRPLARRRCRRGAAAERVDHAPGGARGGDPGAAVRAEAGVQVSAALPVRRIILRNILRGMACGEGWAGGGGGARFLYPFRLLGTLLPPCAWAAVAAGAWSGREAAGRWGRNTGLTLGRGVMEAVLPASSAPLPLPTNWGKATDERTP